MAYIKSCIMPFFERRIKIYNGLFQMDLPLWVVRHAYDSPSRPLVRTLSHRKTSHFGRFLKFYKKAKFTMAYFKSIMPFFEQTMPFSNKESKSIMAYFKSCIMPFFERRIEIYNGLYQILYYALFRTKNQNL